jgi:hypothetical protein
MKLLDTCREALVFICDEGIPPEDTVEISMLLLELLSVSTPIVLKSQSQQTTLVETQVCTLRLVLAHENKFSMHLRRQLGYKRTIPLWQFSRSDDAKLITTKGCSVTLQDAADNLGLQDLVHFQVVDRDLYSFATCRINQDTVL